MAGGYFKKKKKKKNSIKTVATVTPGKILMPEACKKASKASRRPGRSKATPAQSPVLPCKQWCNSAVCMPSCDL